MPSRQAATPLAAPADAYRAAGVDRAAAQRIKDSVERIASPHSDPRVIGGMGGFGGLFRLGGYRRPVLVSGTDGIGTKLLLGRWTGRYEGLGVDLVNACVNDVVVTGADPLFFLDYLAMGAAMPDAVESLVRGMAEACAEAGCVLIGGETAEMPGIYGEGEFDMAGFAVGAVEEEHLLGPDTVREGDLLIGLPSSGVHTNGFSLVRKVFGLDSDPSLLSMHHPDLGRTLGEELSEPHRSYARPLAAIRDRIRAAAHITGGGLVENVPRVLPDGLGAHFETGSWETPPIFGLLSRRGNIPGPEMHRVFNMGLGIVAVCDPAEAGNVASKVPGATVVGSVIGVPPDGERVVFS